MLNACATQNPKGVITECLYGASISPSGMPQSEDPFPSPGRRGKDAPPAILTAAFQLKFAKKVPGLSNPARERSDSNENNPHYSGCSDGSFGNARGAGMSLVAASRTPGVAGTSAGPGPLMGRLPRLSLS